MSPLCVDTTACTPYSMVVQPGGGRDAARWEHASISARRENRADCRAAADHACMSVAYLPNDLVVLHGWLPLLAPSCPTDCVA